MPRDPARLPSYLNHSLWRVKFPSACGSGALWVAAHGPAFSDDATGACGRLFFEVSEARTAILVWTAEHDPSRLTARDRAAYEKLSARKKAAALPRPARDVILPARGGRFW